MYIWMLTLSLVFFCICRAPRPRGEDGWGVESSRTSAINTCIVEGGIEAEMR
jgi:hypothetical protein